MSKKRLVYGIKFWYQLLIGIVFMVMVCESFFATSLIQYMAVWVAFLVCK